MLSYNSGGCFWLLLYVFFLHKTTPCKGFIISGLKHHLCRSSPSDVFLEKDVLKIYSKFTGENPCQSAISIKLLCNFIEIALRHGCFPVYLPHTFRTPFLKNTSGGLLLFVLYKKGMEIKLLYFFSFFINM